MPSISKAKLQDLENQIKDLNWRLTRSEKQADEWKAERDNVKAGMDDLKRQIEHDGWAFRETQNLWKQWIVADKGEDIATIRFPRETFSELLSLLGQ